MLYTVSFQLVNQILEMSSPSSGRALSPGQQPWPQPLLQGCVGKLHQYLPTLTPVLGCEVRSPHCSGHGHCWRAMGHACNGSRILFPLYCHSSSSIELWRKRYFLFSPSFKIWGTWRRYWWGEEEFSSLARGELEWGCSHSQGCFLMALRVEEGRRRAG